MELFSSDIKSKYNIIVVAFVRLSQSLFQICV